MARKTLYKHSYALGYNTRDNPTKIHQVSAQIMENILPNDPNGIPRNGSCKWSNAFGAYNGSGIVLHTFAYSSTLGNKLIVISQNGGTTSIVAKQKGTATVDQLIIQGTGFDFTSLDVSWVRIKDDIYLSDGKANVYIIERQADTTFILRNANIARPEQLVGDNVVLLGVTGSGSLTPGKFIGYSVTYVRRTDVNSQDINGDPERQEFNVDGDVFNPGVLESQEILVQTNVSNPNGERKAIEIGLFENEAQVRCNNLDQLDTQVTHARIYRTLEFDTEIEALGASYRWRADIPIVGANSELVTGTHILFNDGLSNATMAGNFNFSLNIGMDPMPAGRTMTFLKGRLWVGGVLDGPQEFRGRYFYSIPPLDVDFPQKWFSMFLTGKSSLTIGGASGDPVTVTGWKDTDQEDDEFSQIVDVSRNDIIFINSKSIWFLPDGDPETFEPELLNRENGTLFNHSLVHIGDALYYLSNSGPAMIEGRLFKIVLDHTAGEVWPEVFDATIGYFFGLSEPKLVKGYYTRENWILADNSRTICNYMPHKQTGYGPWQFISALSKNIKFGIGSVFDDNELVVYPYNISNTQFYHVLDPTLESDDGADFTMRCKGKAQYMSEKDREIFGEAYSLVNFVQFEDAGDFLLILTSDFQRLKTVWTYEQDDTSILRSTSAENKFRLNIFQPIVEGFLGQHFEIEWVKVHKTPYKFIHKGWSLDIIVRKKRIEFVSSNFQEATIGQIIETGTTPFNFEETGVSTTSITEVPI